MTKYPRQNIQVTFISEIKPQKERFLEKYDCFFKDLCILLEPLLGWERAYVCNDLRTAKESIKSKKTKNPQQYQRSKWHTSELRLRN